MSVLVAYANTPEGAAALAHGRRLAASDGREVFVFDLDARSDAADRSIAPTAPSGAGSERWFARAGEDPNAADELVELAGELGAELIVLGVRSRSPIGKMVLGANVQRIILDASVPVLAVKPDPGE